MEHANVKARDPFIDELKGFAIILVVLGHSVHLYAPDYEETVVFRFCYSFHMALFFVIGGYLCRNKAQHDIQWLGKRARRLLTPWLIWTTIGTLIKGQGLQLLVDNLIIEPSIWFLPCLFLCEACLLMLVHMKKYSVAVFAVIYGILAILGVGFRIRVFEDVFIFLLFYLTGYLFRKRLLALNRCMIGCIAIISVILYVLCMQVYTFGMDGAERFAQEVATHFNMEGKTVLLKMAIWVNSRFFIAFLGVVASTSVLRLIFEWGGTRFLRTTLTCLGRNTMPIYLMSGYCAVTFFNGSINFIFSLILGLMVPCLVAGFLKKWPKVCTLLFGG